MKHSISPSPKFHLSPHGLLALFLASLGLAAGCFSHQPLNVQTFTLNVQAPGQTNLPAGGPALGIRKVQVAGAFDDRHLTYRTGNFSFVKDPYASFLSAPEEEFQAVLLEKLRETGLFGSVTMTGGGRRPEFVAEINVTQLYGDFTKPGAPAAVLSMNVDFRMVTNGLPGKPLLEKDYSQNVELRGATAPELLNGWNTGLEKISAALSSDLHQRIEQN